jgi:phosphoribosyl-ATP pyrophosphohydrolase
MHNNREDTPVVGNTLLEKPECQCPACTETSNCHEVVNRLWNAVDAHLSEGAAVPRRTTRLVADGLLKMSKKLVEEAGEAALAAATDDHAELVAESADVLYHLTVLWAACGISPDEIWAEMNRREVAYGISEKRAKRPRA